MDIKNIIFDLGGVLLNIDYQATVKAFKDLGVKNFEDFFTQSSQNKLFDRLDRGKITPEEFRDELRSMSGVAMSDAEIDKAWNSMILDFPQQKIPMLELISSYYRTFLLSNTNAIHYPAYTSFLQEAHGYDSLAQLFEKEYLSHEVGMRKPDVEIFYHVLEQNNLLPDETLFFDDTQHHVEGARRAGIHAYWIDITREDVTEFFDKGRLKDSFFKKLQSQSEQFAQ